MQSHEVIDEFHKLPLTQQMRIAANVLAATTGRLLESKGLNATDDEKRDRKWSAGTLRVKAHEWEREDRLAAEAEAKRLAEIDEAVNALTDDLYHVCVHPSGLAPSNPDGVRRLMRSRAEALVAAGWAKKASE